VCGTEGLSAIVSMLKSMEICDVDLLARLEDGDVFSWVNCREKRMTKGTWVCSCPNPSEIYLYLTHTSSYCYILL
jgi:hypothetical protein